LPLLFKRLTFPVSTASDKNLNIIENLREMRRTQNCCCWNTAYSNTVFGIGGGNNNWAEHFLRENNLSSFNYFNDENCFVSNEIYETL